jgi:hypothetical protein
VNVDGEGMKIKKSFYIQNGFDLNIKEEGG